MIVKLCGLNDPQNMMDLAKTAVDMIGLNFYHLSPRFIKTELPNQLNNVIKVGVFVNATLEEILFKKEAYQLDFAQLHGDESLSFTQLVNQNIPVIKVFRVDNNFDPTILPDFEFCPYFLFDTKTIKYGGSGKKFNWEELLNFDIKTPFLISGGISPDDLKDIIQFSHPYFRGVDINSGFETLPGYKDIEKVNIFTNSLKQI